MLVQANAPRFWPAGGSGSGLATLTPGAYLTGAAYNGTVNRTFAVDATSANTASKVVARDGAGDFAANIITAVSFVGTATAAASVPASGVTPGIFPVGAFSFTTPLTDASLATLATAGKVANTATTATNLNTVSAIVARDGAGNFSAGVITANLTGNASGTAATVTAAAQPNIVTAVNQTTVGALNAGSITSGFGSIDVGADSISGGAGSFTTGVFSGVLEVNTRAAVGTTASTVTALTVRAIGTLAGMDQYGQSISVSASSAATNGLTGLYVSLRTVAAAFTVANAQSFYAEAPSIGAGSAITTLAGLGVANQGAAGIANAIGVDVAAQSGASTLNIGIRNGGTLLQTGAATFNSTVQLGTPYVAAAVVQAGYVIMKDSSGMDRKFMVGP